MDITIYLPDDLGKWAKDHDLGLSRMLREAVAAERTRRQAAAATLAEAAMTELDVEDDDGNGYTARIHGTQIAAQEDRGGYPAVEVYLGRDGKLYVYDGHSSKLYRDVGQADLRDWLPDDGAYAEAMHALGEEVVIDVGLPE